MQHSSEITVIASKYNNRVADHQEMIKVRASEHTKKSRTSQPKWHLWDWEMQKSQYVYCANRFGTPNICKKQWSVKRWSGEGFGHVWHMTQTGQIFLHSAWDVWQVLISKCNPSRTLESKVIARCEKWIWVFFILLRECRRASVGPVIAASDYITHFLYTIFRPPKQYAINASG